jgi:cytochrome c
MGPTALAVLALVAAVPAAATLDGPRLFQRCYACHSVDPTERSLPGPNLHGLFGRPAGAEAAFDYSPVMREAGRRGLVWTAESLDRFLADPEEVVAGVSMGGVRMRDPIERGALIRWLEQVTR